MLCRLLRFAHGFVFAPQNFFIGWGRLTACIAGHAIQRKNPQDESQRFSKWRLPTLPQRSAVPSAMLSLSAALAPLRSAALRRSLALSRARAPQARTAHTPHGSLRAHTAPHSATPPPMRQTRGGKRRLFLPGQKRYGLSQKKVYRSFFFSSDRRARESNHMTGG